MSKADLIKSEEFAKTIIMSANDEELTIIQLRKALKIAEEIAENTCISSTSISRHDFQSAHIVENPPELFG